MSFIERLKILMQATNIRRCILFLFFMLLIGVEAYFVMPKWQFIKDGDLGDYLKCNTVNSKCYSIKINNDDNGPYFSETTIRPKQ